MKSNTINVPRLFTRTKFCPNCHARGIPFSSSRDLNTSPVRFVVRGTANLEDFTFKIRKQTRPAIRGYTPHVFFLSGEQEIIDGINTYKVYYCCSIEGCGMKILIGQNGERIPELALEETFLSLYELNRIYNSKNSKYFLDFKEPQFLFHYSPKNFGFLNPQ